MGPANRVVLLLIANVSHDPRQILASEADDAIAGLPVDQFSIGNLLVDVVGARALKLTDPFIDGDRWSDGNSNVNVVRSPPPPPRERYESSSRE